MRLIPFITSAVITVGAVVALNKPWGKLPAIGKLLSIQEGLWHNAESTNKSFDGKLKISGLKGKVTVKIDDRLVPHVFADNDADAYAVQGYLHAMFRLWQMDFQTRAAGGRLSEIVGEGNNGAILKFDREQLRSGMKFGAEKSLAAMEQDPLLKEALDNYTKGINEYIKNLKAKDYPIEFKLLGYQPEPWSNLKTALFLKYMSKDLAGAEEDFEFANAAAVFDDKQMQALFPYGQAIVDPIVPKEFTITKPSINMVPPKAADSIGGFVNNINAIKPAKENGSNNWAVNGKKTKSGRPILCNDPHLGLNAPALWFEMQIHTPTHNAYGASFPGSPCVVIGFNDSCSWGFTNAMRDVKDYFEIKFKDDKKEEYWFNNAWRKITNKVVEPIKIKGKATLYDTIVFTHFGPVMYDNNFGNKLGDKKYYACKWKAHDPSSEIKAFYNLDRAKNIDDYYKAIQYLECPGQNVVFATKKNDIAIVCAGKFPAKWKGQGRAIMPGTDSTFDWRGYIPFEENPKLINPARNFVSSANQLPAMHTSYPYFLGGDYPPYRGLIINRKLAALDSITPETMQLLQNDNYNVFAEEALPLLIRHSSRAKLSTEAQNIFVQLAKWNLQANADLEEPTLFNIWWKNVFRAIVNDEMAKAPNGSALPDVFNSTLIEALQKDTAWSIVDNISTPAKENLTEIVVAALEATAIKKQELLKENKLKLGDYKGTYALHLSRALAPFNINQMHNGGGDHIINASKDQHGPSWRMIVHMTDKIEAYAIYPGGQSGNPGSKYYDNFAADWRDGRYYKLLFLKDANEKAETIKWTIEFTNA
jgi:penicillin G amidase